jgi:hypothetical protein
MLANSSLRSDQQRWRRIAARYISADVHRRSLVQNAVIYCLDVEKYQDANGDGVGDFEGLMRRLDYRVLELSVLATNGYAPLADLVRYATGTKTTVAKALRDALRRSVPTYIAIGFWLADKWWLAIPLLVAPIVATLTMGGGLEGTIQGLAARKAVIASIMIVLTTGGAGVVFVRQLRSQLLLRKRLRTDFARRRMSNDDLAQALAGVSDGPAIVACLLTSETGRPTPDAAVV